MVTGHRAFSGDTKISTIAAILNREPQPLAATTPTELDRLIMRCLRKDSGRRFQTMADLKVALQELKDESDSGHLGTTAKTPVRRGRWGLVLAALTALTLTTAAVFWLKTSQSTPGVLDRHLRQLTFDTGETSFPSLSPDAKLVAYQSDR